jgi:hypothetical protein
MDSYHYYNTTGGNIMSRGAKHILVRGGIVIFGFLAMIHWVWFSIPVFSVILGIIGLTIALFSAVILIGEPYPPFGWSKCNCGGKALVTAYVMTPYGHVMCTPCCVECAKKKQEQSMKWNFA